jgi:hypothetical protein
MQNWDTPFKRSDGRSFSQRNGGPPMLMPLLFNHLPGNLNTTPAPLTILDPFPLFFNRQVTHFQEPEHDSTLLQIYAVCVFPLVTLFSAYTF